jgi:outer membrane cobalamin receptor
LGFDPSTDDTGLRDHPAQDLHDIYQLAGCAYNKTKANVQRTVEVLDYARIYLDLAHKVSDLQALVEHIDNFLSRKGAG